MEHAVGRRVRDTRASRQKVDPRVIFNDPEAQIRRSRQLKRVLRQSAAAPSVSGGAADDEASEPQQSAGAPGPVAAPPAQPDRRPQHPDAALPDTRPGSQSEAMQQDEVGLLVSEACSQAPSPKKCPETTSVRSRAIPAILLKHTPEAALAAGSSGPTAQPLQVNTGSAA